MQGWLEHANIENAFAQRYRRRMCSDKFADDFPQASDHFRLMQTLAQPEALHQFWNQLSRRLPPIAARFSLRRPRHSAITAARREGFIGERES